MDFNKHYNLKGKHSFLSPSSYHWVNYDDAKFRQAYANHQAAARGTRLHAFAAEAISLGIKLPRSRKTLNMYVNDGIGFRMTPEQPLYFSDNCFGTADAISFRRDRLRIHDLKTGTTLASMVQLELYAAIFCLEYDIHPSDIHIDLRLYQNDAIEEASPEADTILHHMDRIVYFDELIESMKLKQ